MTEKPRGFWQRHRANLSIGKSWSCRFLCVKPGPIGQILSNSIWRSGNRSLLSLTLGLRKYGLAIMLMGLVEAEFRRMSEERKLADSKVVLRGAGDEGANERRLKTLLWTFWKMIHSF